MRTPFSYVAHTSTVHNFNQQSKCATLRFDAALSSCFQGFMRDISFHIIIILTWIFNAEEKTLPSVRISYTAYHAQETATWTANTALETQSHNSNYNSLTGPGKSSVIIHNNLPHVCAYFSQQHIKMYMNVKSSEPTGPIASSFKHNSHTSLINPCPNLIDFMSCSIWPRVWCWDA